MAKLATTPRRCTNLREHSRRHFLRDLFGASAGAMLLGKLPVHSLAPSAFTAALSEEPSDRVLVLIRLKGGNDGLNTVLPVHDFDTYRRARPNIYIPRADAVNFRDDLAVHPRLASLRGLFDAGGMRVMHAVGYPRQNLSHFRSSDIWATGSHAEEVVNSGMLGRYLQETYPDFLTDPPTTPPAIQIGGAGNLLFNNRDDFNYAISTNNPEELYRIASTGQLYSLDDLPDCAYGDQLGYLRAVANTTFRYAGVLDEAYRNGANATEYLDDYLGNQLALVARLLKGGLATRLFVVELDGFDTHANQPDAHAALLDSVASNVDRFYADLAAEGTDQRVLAMTFSEFGRRIEQNGSTGTDHGAAAPLFLFGPALNSNADIGTPPDLSERDANGNLIHGIDFRHVYATVLSRWLCIEDGLVDAVMGASFPRIDAMGLSCTAGTVATKPAEVADPHLRAFRSGSAIVVRYRLPAAAADVRLTLFDALGRRLSVAAPGRVTAGENEYRFPAAVVSGVYTVSLDAGGRRTAAKVALF